MRIAPHEQGLGWGIGWAKKNPSIVNARRGSDRCNENVVMGKWQGAIDSVDRDLEPRTEQKREMPGKAQKAGKRGCRFEKSDEEHKNT